ncbi:MAG: hypothetical protein RI911_472, partial [Candidatus Parcubacteria bacterium]
MGKTGAVGYKIDSVLYYGAMNIAVFEQQKLVQHICDEIVMA